MFERTDRSWENWAQKDPYFAVLSADRFKTDASSADPEAEFHRSGAEHVRDVLAAANALGLSVRRERAMDFGCGVGRLVVPLSREFKSVDGYDISPTMLELAAATCAAQGVANAAFKSSANGIARPEGGYDFVHTVLVMQHIRPDHGYRLIGQMIDSLAPGGVLALHVNLARNTGWLRSAVAEARRFVLPLHWLANLAGGRGWDAPLMQMNIYSLNRIFLDAFGRGVDLVGCRPFHEEPHPGVIAFFRRK